MEWLDGPATALADEVRAGRLSAIDVVEAALERARLTHEKTNAMQSIDADGAIAAAKLVDQHRRGRLAGVPVVVKDNLLQRGRPCTCGSRILEGYRGTYDATVVERLTAAGAIILGRGNMDEFAMGSSTEHCAWGPVRNPLDGSLVPGGSSGGSAVACADGAVPLSLGSDTGGSVRQPAAFCGIVGFKPTYGRVSRYGLVAFASSLDQISPFARTVEDAAAILEVIAGEDPRDATCATEPLADWRAACHQPVKGLRIGVPREFFGEGLHPGVRARVMETAELLRSEGAIVEETSVPLAVEGVACYYVLAPAEASSNLARFDGMRYGPREAPAGGGAASLADVMEATRGRFGREVKRRILIGTYALSAGYVDAYYHRAQRVRAALTAELERALSRYDALLSPTAPTPAFGLGAVVDPLQMYLSDIYTIPAALAGLPAISVPCGDVDGLPAGAQITTRRWDEATALRIAAAIERSL